jgi:hypothetical protein
LGEDYDKPVGDFIEITVNCRRSCKENGYSPRAAGPGSGDAAAPRGGRFAPALPIAANGPSLAQPQHLKQTRTGAGGAALACTVAGTGNPAAMFGPKPSPLAIGDDNGDQLRQLIVQA